MFSFWCLFLLQMTARLVSVNPTSEVAIDVVELIVGNGSTILAYNVMGPAYDVALTRVAHQYPNVFRSLTVNRYFIGNELGSCAESTALLIGQLYRLLIPKENGQGSRNQFRVVLSPGCMAEVLALGDFTQEIDVPVIASSTSIPVPARYPTVVAFSTVSFAVLARSVAETLRYFLWTPFNLLCDTNPDAKQIQAVEGVCSTIIKYVQSQTGQLSVIVNHFDSRQPNTYKVVLTESRKYSTVIVLATFPVPSNELLLEASSLGMDTGEYVFFLLPLSQFEQAPQTDEELHQLSSILPFVFLLTFDEVNWSAIASETETMDNLSETKFNWTIAPENQHNVIRLSAYESVLTMAQVLDENYSQLSTMSARTFASKFSNQVFNLPSRTVRVSATRARLCDVTVKQYRNSSGYYTAILRFSNERLLLYPINGTAIQWPGVVAFPPSSRPLCYLPSGARCLSSKNVRNTITATIGSIAALLLILLSVTIHRKITDEMQQIEFHVGYFHSGFKLTRSDALQSGDLRPNLQAEYMQSLYFALNFVNE